jgi:hypothetical protein
MGIRNVFLDYFDMESLYFSSFMSELSLVVFVALSSLVFSMKRNDHIPWAGHLDAQIKETIPKVVGAASKVLSCKK